MSNQTGATPLLKNAEEILANNYNFAIDDLALSCLAQTTKDIDESINIPNQMVSSEFKCHLRVELDKTPFVDTVQIPLLKEIPISPKREGETYNYGY